MLSDEWLPRYRLLENFTAKWNGNGDGNGNAYDRGDYNSSFALRAVELKNVNNGQWLASHILLLKRYQATILSSCSEQLLCIAYLQMMLIP